MSSLTRILVVLIAVALPVTAASAAKYGRPRVQQNATTEATAAPNRAQEPLDTTAVEMLRTADREDLNEHQMQQLEREVGRLQQMQSKANSDGDLSSRDAERLYESAVRSCQKIMTPSDVNLRTKGNRTNRGTTTMRSKR